MKHYHSFTGVNFLRLEYLKIDKQTDRYIYLYSAYKSKESLGASVAKEMCFQRSCERIEGMS